jgi:3-phenylpropionate/trans-cinnamate dioxygenase ferredoxin subunit
MSDTWVEVCAADEIDEEDVVRFDHAGRTFAIYRSPEDTYHATDGLCTHEKIHLADGLVMDHVIECPKHNGRFNYKTGEAKGAPVCVDLKTYPVKVEGGTVFHLAFFVFEELHSSWQTSSSSAPANVARALPSR